MNSLQLFDFKGKQVRVVIIDGEPWFVAKDVCERLNIAWTGKQTLSSLPDSWIRVRSFLTPQGNQDLIIISEAGMYKFAFRSNKEEAEAFTNWVAADVLPTLRKTGKYELTIQPKELPEKATEMQATALVFESFHSIGTLVGFAGNQLTLFCNKGTKNTTGIDALALGESSQLAAEVQEALLIPKQIGERLGGLSSIKVNKMLEQLGLQVHTSYVGKGNVTKKRWELTEKGKKYGIYLDTGKKHSDGTPVRSIQWYESVINLPKGSYETLN